MTESDDYIDKCENVVNGWPPCENYRKLLKFVKSVSQSYFEPKTLNESYMQTNSIILASKALLKEIGEIE